MLDIPHHSVCSIASSHVLVSWHICARFSTATEAQFFRKIFSRKPNPIKTRHPQTFLTRSISHEGEYAVSYSVLNLPRTGKITHKAIWAPRFGGHHLLLPRLVFSYFR